MLDGFESATVIALSVCGLLTAIHLASIALAASRLGRSRGATTFPDGAPISLVRPVCGLETFSEETLARGFALSYPNYEIIFCVADGNDPVLPLVRRLIAEHPAVPSRVLVGDVRVSDNPKLNNCVRGWDEARHDWVVLADSNVLMPKDYLQQLQSAWREDTGLVCSTPIGSRPDGFFAEIECAFLNTLQARWQYSGAALGFGFAQGKSMLWNKPFLEERGGIRALGAEIAEDAAATKLVRLAGRKVHLVPSPFSQPLGPRKLSEVWSRQLRWARLRRITFPRFFAPEIGIGALFPFVLAGVLAGTDEAAAGLVLMAVLWYGAEFALARHAGWYRPLRLLSAMIVRDAMLPAIWAGAWFRSAIVWRGNAMDIRAKSPLRLRARESAA
jgi:ceramide glucosyltransferase